MFVVVVVVAVAVVVDGGGAAVFVAAVGQQSCIETDCIIFGVKSYSVFSVFSPIPIRCFCC